MDVFKEWNEGGNLLHVNRPAINSTTIEIFPKGFKDLK